MSVRKVLFCLIAVFAGPPVTWVFLSEYGRWLYWFGVSIGFDHAGSLLATLFSMCAQGVVLVLLALAHYDLARANERKTFWEIVWDWL